VGSIPVSEIPQPDGLVDAGGGRGVPVGGRTPPRLPRCCRRSGVDRAGGVGPSGIVTLVGPSGYWHDRGGLIRGGKGLGFVGRGLGFVGGVAPSYKGFHFRWRSSATVCGCITDRPRRPEPPHRD
jgi:hypothetical protein